MLIFPKPQIVLLLEKKEDGPQRLMIESIQQISEEFGYIFYMFWYPGIRLLHHLSSRYVSLQLLVTIPLGTLETNTPASLLELLSVPSKYYKETI